MTFTITQEEGEHWWGGCIDDGHLMPYRPGFHRDLMEQRGNQVQPLLVSNRGRWIWSEFPFRFTVTETEVIVDGEQDVVLRKGNASSLSAAVKGASSEHFPPSGLMPDRMLFSHPQYNTWIELQYDQSQKGILEYARRLLDEGYPPGVLMIDDSWQRDYGRWVFDPDRFPDAAQMTGELHKMGFKVMLWVCPEVSPTGRTYLDGLDQGIFILDSGGRPAIREWWNGHSAILDMTNPRSVEWLRAQLRTLQCEFGIDGFKFDAGDFPHYRIDDNTARRGHPGIQSEAWAKFAENWPLNELRASWKMGNRPLAQRLRDKTHSWGLEGLSSCIPNILALSLVGHPFSCPDMVGGGEYHHFSTHSANLDGEIFVRHAQLAALLPMQQFSAAPWRLPSESQAKLCLDAAKLHLEHGELICGLAEKAAGTGDPIVRPLAWDWNDDCASGVTDQFLLGENILVAPVVEKGAGTRTVLFPPGDWIDPNGKLFQGPNEFEVEAPLETLPRFYRRRET